MRGSINPVFSPDPKPPALAGGVFTVALPGLEPDAARISMLA
jgi:hypothetical protein